LFTEGQKPVRNFEGADVATKTFTDKVGVSKLVDSAEEKEGLVTARKSPVFCSSFSAPVIMLNGTIRPKNRIIRVKNDFFEQLGMGQRYCFLFKGQGTRDGGRTQFRV